jgi:hypothetical protein
VFLHSKHGGILKLCLGWWLGFALFSSTRTSNSKQRTLHCTRAARLLALFFDCKLFQMCPSHYSTPAAQNIVEADDPVMLEAVDDQLTPVESGRSCPSSRLSPWMTGL